MGSFIHGFMDYLFIGLVRVLIAGQTALFNGLAPWISQAITALDPATHAACIFSGIRRTSDFSFRLKYKKPFAHHFAQKCAATPWRIPALDRVHPLSEGCCTLLYKT